jgi:hypothetical protein
MITYLSAITDIDVDKVASYIVAAIALGAAVFERLKASKKSAKTEAEQTLLSDAKMHEERAKMFQEVADQNKSLYIAEREEHQKTREYWHEKATEYQKTLSGCQERLAEFQAQPNFSEIVRFIQQQAETSTKILRGIEQVLEYIKIKIDSKAL